MIRRVNQSLPGNSSMPILAHHRHLRSLAIVAVASILPLGCAGATGTRDDAIAGETPTSTASPAATDAIAPGSWSDFTSALTDNGDLGWWQASGVTTDVWKTLPAGIPYRYLGRLSLDEAGRQVVRSFTYTNDRGEVISNGSQTFVWDDASKAVIWSQSGFDLGKPWSDSGRVIGLAPTGLVLGSAETGGGETFELRTTIERTGENTRRRTVARVAGDATPFVQEFTRVNFLVEALNGWDPTGTWVTDFGGMQLVSIASWSADRRCVVAHEGPRSPDGTHIVTGTSLMWFDLDTRTIRQKYVSSMGMVLDGEVVEVSGTRLRTRFTGTDAEGVALHAFVTSEVDGDTMTSQFSDMTYDGKAAMPAWAQAPMTATRERDGE